MENSNDIILFGYVRFSNVLKSSKLKVYNHTNIANYKMDQESKTGILISPWLEER